MLAEFVNQGLGENEVRLIELMMKPEKDKKLPEPWKYREFLCEVATALISVWSIIIVTTFKISKIYIIVTD